MLFSTVMVWAVNSVVTNFLASSNGKEITLSWSSNDESGVDKYEIERSSKESSMFNYITSVIPTGSYKTYKYIDKPSFSAVEKDNSPQSATHYSYRIKISYKDASYDYSPVAKVSHDVSGYRRTWGMIKELFK